VGVEAQPWVQFGVAGEERDRLNSHDVARDCGHNGEPAIAEAFGVAGAEDGAGRLLDQAGGVVDQGLANGRDQRFVGEDGSDFLLGDVHGSLDSLQGN
jgi:hypothetical protein